MISTLASAGIPRLRGLKRHAILLALILLVTLTGGALLAPDAHAESWKRVINRSYGTCLRDSGGTPVALICTGSTYQQWSIESDSGAAGTYYYRNRGSGRCLYVGSADGDIRLSRTACGFNYTSAHWTKRVTTYGTIKNRYYGYYLGSYGSGTLGGFRSSCGLACEWKAVT